MNGVWSQTLRNAAGFESDVSGEHRAVHSLERNQASAGIADRDRARMQRVCRVAQIQAQCRENLVVA